MHPAFSLGQSFCSLNLQWKESFIVLCYCITKFLSMLGSLQMVKSKVLSQRDICQKLFHLLKPFFFFLILYYFQKLEQLSNSKIYFAINVIAFSHISWAFCIWQKEGRNHANLFYANSELDELSLLHDSLDQFVPENKWITSFIWNELSKKKDKMLTLIFITVNSVVNTYWS